MQKIAHAILLVDGKYVLQLRDNNPEIAVPGMWSLFGGSIEESEDHYSGILRELKEELNLTINQIRFLWDFEEVEGPLEIKKRFYFYEADITTLWGSHELLEGQDINCFSCKELQALKIPPLIQDVLSRHFRERFLGNSTTNVPSLIL
ncbi:MAG: NUDIX domain-containing protein [Nitrospina sp.]|jgi:8-oxo-dGTP pyrophosphatase MutT (NUDIX family)|nr:NUDIX domain-containing protein [Nitrospina sp.]